jgi:hypothetical protein
VAKRYSAIHHTVGAIADWVRKSSKEASRKNTTVVMLIPARTDTKWFHDYILNRVGIRFLKGRLKFETNGTQADPHHSSAWSLSCVPTNDEKTKNKPSHRKENK